MRFLLSGNKSVVFVIEEDKIPTYGAYMPPSPYQILVFDASFVLELFLGSKRTETGTYPEKQNNVAVSFYTYAFLVPNK